ncbi:MAG: PBP1A family penicillin-binding protein [Candidatus Binatia bacterium]|nr:PBP1A family penicillin-binding protein [Candidatus Binatia bacterium]
MARRRKAAKRKASKNKKGPRRPFTPFLLGFAALLISLGGGGGFLVYSQFTENLPSVEKLLDYQPSVTTRVFAGDGSVLAEFFVEKRYLEPIHKIPRVVQLAFVAAEDATFYDHTGIDFISIGRAAFENYRAGATRQGGSTITQQVVKALLLSPERSYERKLKEVFLAMQLEHELTKDEILYLYLNQIYLGSGSYGVQAASRDYFGKDVSDISLAEAALLAGLPQAPSRYSPRRHMEQALARQRYVLRQMVKSGFITRDEARDAEAQEIVLIESTREQVRGPAPYFVEHVRRYLVKRYGGTAAYKLGLDVHTTLDPRAQLAAERAVQEGIREIDERQGFRGPRKTLTQEQWRPMQAAAEPTPPGDLPETGATLEVVVVPGRDGNVRRAVGGVHVLWAGGRSHIGTKAFEWAARGNYEPVPGDLLQAVVQESDGNRFLALAHDNGTQGALVAMAPETGDIVAMVGGLDYQKSEFNRATQALRQPGSAFKPLIFTAAMDRGFTPTTVIQDTPVSYHIGPGQTWSPKNFSKRFHGPTTLREALTKSRNVVTVKLTKAMGLNYLLDYLPHFGLNRPIPKNLSIALGTSEVTLMEMVEAYGVFANLGSRVEPRFITSITDRDGRLLEQTPVQTTPEISPETAYITVNLMRSVVENGTGKRARLERAVAGKTGTTNDLRDAWFMGYTPELLAGVWVGYDSDRTLGKKETGGRSAAPIWKSFMEEALEGVPVKDFPVPRDIVLVNVDKKSGERARPGQAGSMIEAYRRGTEPPPLPDPATDYAATGDEREQKFAAPEDHYGNTGMTSNAAALRRRRAAARDTHATRQWGDRVDADPGRRRWGERPASDPYRRRWGDSAPRDESLPGWAQATEPAQQEPQQDWGRSLNTGRWVVPPSYDSAGAATGGNAPPRGRM